MINTNCKHESLTVHVTHKRNYLVRIEHWLLTSASLDSEEELVVSATCARCGYEVFVASARRPNIKAPKFTKAISDFERQVKQLVDLDAFVNELSEGPNSPCIEEEEWQG
jgi:hypothetical protein